MNRFEQLIEYVINDDEQKARELFHDIVVEKSRQIYEDIMAEEAEEIEEGADEDLEEGMGGDASNDLIDDVEMEEESDMNMEAEGDDDMGDDDMGDDDMGGMGDDDMGGMGDDDMGGDDMGGDEPATKDDIMNLEDKLDQLMAEFEDLMSDNDDMGGDGDMMGPDEGGDALEMDDTEEMGMMEAVSLKAAPKPVTGEQGAYSKSPVAANAGAKGPVGNTVKPVHAGGEMGGKHDTSAYSNNTKDLIGDFQNKAGASMKDQKPATKPHLGQASGVNTKSPVARG